MTTNNAVSGALERPNPEVCARSALSTHYTSPCATIVALFDNWQAVVRTDRSPSFHPALSLAPVGKYKEREEAAYSLGLLGWASLSDALHPGLSVKRRGERTQTTALLGDSHPAPFNVKRKWKI